MTTPRETKPHRLPPQPPAEPPAPATQPHQRPEVPATPPPPPIEVSGRVGGDVVAGDYEKNIRAGRDVVGRDVVTNTTSSTTNVGFSAAAVQRLIITVGVMVFVTAACFFSGGVLVGGGALAALDRPVNSDDAQAAADFAGFLQSLRNLPPGEAVQLSFTEQQLSAYFRQVIAPTLPLGISDARVRLLNSGDLVVGGKAGDLGNVNFAATFSWQTEPGAPLRLNAAAVKVVPWQSHGFGWVAVPTQLLQPMADGINALFGDVRVSEPVPEAGNPGYWLVTAVGQ